MRSKTFWIAHRLFLGVVPGLIIFGGCGSNPPSPPDADAAHAALRTALDAWKNGDSLDALGTAQPPILVSDWRWRTGVKLVRYEIAERDRAYGHGLRCPVQLWIDTGKKKNLQEKVEYDVATNPALTVSRVGDR
jgi:hypothetical protein